MLKKAIEQDWTNVKQNLTKTKSDICSGRGKEKNNEINPNHIAPRENSEEKTTIKQNETNEEWNSVENFFRICPGNDIVKHDKKDLDHVISHKQL